MSKSSKSFAVLSCAIVPVLYGASAFAQDVITEQGYPDGNPIVLPQEWPGAAPNTALGLGGPSATGTNAVLGSNYFNGQFNDNVDGAPNNGGQATVDNPMGTASGNIVVIAQTFNPSTSFKLGGFSFFLSNGGDSGFQANPASVHLFQLNNTVNSTSSTYNLSTQAVGYVSPTQDGDLLGGGQGAVFTPSASNNIEQFVLTGADQVTLQANTEYAIEFFVDQVDSGDSLGMVRMSGADSNPSPVPYAGGAEYAVTVGEMNAAMTQSADDQTYTNNATLTRQSGIFAGPLRESIFAVYSAPATTTTGTWTGAATAGSNSDWTNSGNWSAAAVPGSTPGDSALFASGASSVNVSLNGTQTLGQLTFNGPAFTIAQGTSGTLTMEGVAAGSTAHIDDLFGSSNITAPVALASNVQIAVGQANNALTISGNISGAGSVTLLGDTMALSAGTVVFSGTNSYGGGTTVSAGTLLIAAHGALPSGSVTIANGNLDLASSTGLATIKSLAITGNGTLDVANNHVIINYGSGTDPIASIAALLTTGFNGGAWNGPGGIISSVAAVTSGYGLGYADSADAGNPASLASGTIEVKYALLGDANLDGIVNGIDFGILAANFNKGISAWDGGDFFYHGVVNGVDFGALAANFNKGASGASIGEPAYDDPAILAFATANGLLADVPEPTVGALATMATTGLLLRRSRQKREVIV